MLRQPFFLHLPRTNTDLLFYVQGENITRRETLTVEITTSRILTVSLYIVTPTPDIKMLKSFKNITSSRSNIFLQIFIL